MIDIRALIMSPAFENAARFYQMFSTDVTYYGDQILVEGKKISRVTMSSVVDLLNALKKQLLAGEKHFLIACHGSPEGLLIRAAPGHTTTLTDKILDRLLAAADDETGARDTLLGTTDKSGKKLFTKESQVDDLLSLIKDVRGGQIELIEFRCCNLGAGAGLKKIHKLFRGNLTTAARPKFERRPCYGVHAQGLTTTPHPTARITKFREAPVLEGLHKNLRECVLFIVQSGTCRRRAWHLGRDVNCGL